MTNIWLDFDYEYNGLTKKALNVPAYQCPQCDNTIVTDFIMAKLKGYTAQKCDSIVDFAKHEQQETDDYVVLHMLGFM